MKPSNLITHFDLKRSFPLALVCLCFFLLRVSANTAKTLENVFESIYPKTALLNGVASPDEFIKHTSLSDWTGSDQHSFLRVLDSAVSSELTLNVEVRLVCFDGDGNQRYTIREDDLLAYINSASDSRVKGMYSITPSRTRASLFAQSISTLTTDDVNTGTEDQAELLNALQVGSASSFSSASSDSTVKVVGPNGLPLLTHKLPLHHRIVFKVSKTPQRLCTRYTKVVQDQIQEQSHRLLQLQQTLKTSPAASSTTREVASPLTHVYSVNSDEIEKIIMDDRKTLNRPHVLYLVSPSPATVKAHSSDTRAPNAKEVVAKYTLSSLSKEQIFDRLDPRKAWSKPVCESQVLLSSSVPTRSFDASESAANSPNSRWGLVDLTAGPVSIGAQSSGEGSVTELSIPSLDILFARHQTESKLSHLSPATGTTPSPSLAGKKSNIDPRYRKMTDSEKQALAKADFDAKGHEFIASLSSLVNRYISGVVSPPLWKYPRTYARKVVINVFVVSDYSSSPSMFANPELFGRPNPKNTFSGAQKTDSDAEKVPDDSRAIRQWREISRRLEEIAPEGQSITVDIHSIPMEDCPLCLTGLMHSMRSSADTRESLVESTMSMGTQISSHIDSAELGLWMRRFRDEFWNSATPGSGAGSKTGSSANIPPVRVSSSSRAGNIPVDDAGLPISEIRVLDAFLFDLNSSQVILLDKESQATATPHINHPAAAVHDPTSTQDEPRYTSTLLAVQTKASVAPVDFVCNNSLMEVDHSDASIALFGVLLNELYGVAPSDLSVNSARVPLEPGQISQLGVEHNYLWSASATPYGPFNVFNTAPAQGISPAIALTEPVHFGIRDSVHRNVLFTEIASSVEAIRNLRAKYAKFSSFFAETAGRETFTTLARRSRLMEVKFNRIRELSAMADYQKALYFARSARHDAVAIEKLVTSVMSKFRPTLSCENEESNQKKQVDNDGQWEKSGIEDALSAIGSVFGSSSSSNNEDQSKSKTGKHLSEAMGDNVSKAKQRSAVRSQYDEDKSSNTKIEYDANTLRNREYSNDDVTYSGNQSIRPNKSYAIFILVLELIGIVLFVACVALLLFSNVCCCRRPSSSTTRNTTHNQPSPPQPQSFSSTSPRNNMSAYSNTFAPARANTKSSWFNIFGNSKNNKEV